MFLPLSLPEDISKEATVALERQIKFWPVCLQKALLSFESTINKTWNTAGLTTHELKK